MARTVDPVLHAERRGHILDCAAELVLERGPEGVTIAAVIGAAGISKGAFYHYFSGKEDVLVALIERQIQRWQELADVAMAQGSDARGRLRSLVETLALAKSGDRELLVKAVPALISGRHTAIQARLRRSAANRFLPTLQAIVEEGVEAGEFEVASPAASARVVLSLMQELGEVFTHDLVEIAQGRGDTGLLAEHVRAYGDAIPAVLGAAPESDGFIQLPDLDQWAEAARAFAPEFRGRNDSTNAAPPKPVGTTGTTKEQI